MASLSDRLKALEQRVIDAVGAIPALVQVIHGTRTEVQQKEYDNAIANGVDVITIGVVDCRKESRHVN